MLQSLSHACAAHVPMSQGCGKERAPAFGGAGPKQRHGCWEKDCTQNCRRRALEDLPVLVSALLPLHNCTKLGQDVGFSAMVQRASAESKYIIGSLQVCQRAFLRLTGLSSRRLHRLKAGRYDARYGNRSKGDPRNACSEACAKINGHLWHCPLSDLLNLMCHLICAGGPTPSPLAPQKIGQICSCACDVHLNFVSQAMSPSPSLSPTSA